MNKRIMSAMLVTGMLLSGCTTANKGPMQLSVEGVGNKQPMSVEFAYCAPKQKFGGNTNPRVTWSNVPAGTKSLALLVVDHDVPVDRRKANKKGKVIAEKAIRQDFYHWVLADIPPTVTEINKGQDSKGVNADGKPTGKTPYGVTGLNDYSKAGAPQHGGYDGPCPPWNDARIHNYHFQLFALDVPSLKLDQHGRFTGSEVMGAMRGHILGQSEVVGSYTLNKAKMVKPAAPKAVKHKAKAKPASATQAKK